jgi:prepilin peptidase CpaA
MLATQAHLHAALIVFVLLVALIDWCTHRIPNLLCATAAVLGLTSQMWLHGEAGLLSALGGAAVGFGMFLPFYAMRAFGAGDVKAMATVGIFLGVPATALAAGSTLIAGSLLGLLVLWFKPAYAGAALHRLLGLLVGSVWSLRAPKHDWTSQPTLRFPYGIAIACGTAVALLVIAD